VIDAGKVDKVPWLLKDLNEAGLIPDAQEPADEDDYPKPDGSIPLVIATHPHLDHISGMEDLLHIFRQRIVEFWDPGYYHTSASYLGMMAEIERNRHLLYVQPTSGCRKWIGDVVITVMAPSIQLKNRFDTYGTNINDSSISIRVEYPASRVILRDEERALIDEPTTMSLLLGADSQTLSWSYLLTDFPHLPNSETATAKAIKAATGNDLLRSDIMKISHHCSKRGVNLELMERIDPRVSLVSSVSGSGRYKFPHEVSQEIIREALDPVAKTGGTHDQDWELGIFYTSDKDTDEAVLGSIALVLGTTSITMWRFSDEGDQRVSFANARRMV
jgi:hypothetical protein